MNQSFSIRTGHFLYRFFFPVYNLVYGIFKRKQDRELIDLEKHIIKKGNTVLDIGANIGFYTRIFSSLVSETGRVYAFEPDRTNFRYLAKNCKGFTNVELINKAVSDKTGTIHIYTSKEINVDHRTYPVDDFSEKIEIEGIAIDDLIGDKKVDFIKMDIQGYELSALKGMRQTLEKNPGISIITELWPHGLRAAGVTVKQLLDFVTEAGFKVYSVEKEKIHLFDMEKLNHYEQLAKEHYTNILITRQENILNEKTA